MDVFRTIHTVKAISEQVEVKHKEAKTWATKNKELAQEVTNAYNDIRNTIAVIQITADMIEGYDRQYDFLHPDTPQSTELVGVMATLKESRIGLENHVDALMGILDKQLPHYMNTLAVFKKLRRK